MALSPQLLQYKSSGVYRLEFDKSQTVNIPAETIRLVVGHSKKGPYNTPVLVETTEQFINVFGSIDKNLEKSGMFFHRSALAALTRGPILALNTALFDSADLIEYVAAATNGSVDELNAVPVNANPFVLTLTSVIEIPSLRKFSISSAESPFAMLYILNKTCL